MSGPLFKTNHPDHSEYFNQRYLGRSSKRQCEVRWRLVNPWNDTNSKKRRGSRGKRTTDDMYHSSVIQRSPGESMVNALSRYDRGRVRFVRINITVFFLPLSLFFFFWFFSFLFFKAAPRKSQFNRLMTVSKPSVFLSCSQPIDDPFPGHPLSRHEPFVYFFFHRHKSRDSWKIVWKIFKDF